MSKKKKVMPTLTFRDSLSHERLDFGQVKPYTQTHTSPKDYDRKQRKKEDRKMIREEW